MTWNVEYTDEFGSWWDRLAETEQEAIDAHVQLLEARGPQLPFPYSSGISQSKHTHMRELRIQCQAEPYRILYAFDPLRTAILLLGGCKASDDRWYERRVPVADRLYDEHIAQLEREGLI